MICCDRCEEWYHYKCIGISQVSRAFITLNLVNLHFKSLNFISNLSILLAFVLLYKSERILMFWKNGEFYRFASRILFKFVLLNNNLKICNSIRFLMLTQSEVYLPPSIAINGLNSHSDPFNVWGMTTIKFYLFHTISVPHVIHKFTRLYSHLPPEWFYFD